MTHNTEVREFAAGDALAESDLDKVNGGAVMPPNIVWEVLLGQYGFPATGKGTPFLDSLDCHTQY